MANTLTGLIQYMYDSADKVSREVVGFIPAVYLNPAADMVAKDQDVTYDIVPTAALYDVTPSNAIPALDDSTVGTGTMKITKSRATKFHWTGDDEAKIGREAKTGIQNNKFSQAFRALVNEMEADLGALYTSASRVYGTAGTTPFATAGDFSDAAEVRRILFDNGAPMGDVQLVINSAAGAKLRGYQSQAQMQGSADQLRRGTLLNIHDLTIRESSKVKAHTKGTGASYLVNNASNYAAGSTTIAADTGSGTILAGDVLLNGASGRDANRYVVGSALSGGSLAINAPGIVNAWNDNDAFSVGNSYAANMCFSRSAIHLLTRLPLMPEGGDQADDIIVIQDPVSGIFFQVAMYKAYRAVLIEVAVSWGVKAVKPAHIALLIG